MVVVALVLLFTILMLVTPFRFWVMASMCGAQIPFLELYGMRCRKSDVKSVVLSRILLVKCGVPEITVTDLEAHDLAGGRVMDVARAMVDARRDGVELDWETACTMDREGRNVIEHVRAAAGKAARTPQGAQ